MPDVPKGKQIALMLGMFCPKHPVPLDFFHTPDEIQIFPTGVHRPWTTLDGGQKPEDAGDIAGSGFKPVRQEGGHRKTFGCAPGTPKNERFDGLRITEKENAYSRWTEQTFVSGTSQIVEPPSIDGDGNASR